MFSSLEFELGSVWEASGAGNCLGVTPSISRWPFGYRHGLRASELVALRWDDIDLATVVMRNIGGRITPGLLEQLGLLGRIGEVAGEIPGGGGEFHSMLQHCSITTAQHLGASTLGGF
jgi:integrase